LHYRTRGTGCEPDSEWQAHKTFLAREAHFNAFSIRHDIQNGRQSALHKISKFNRFSDIVQEKLTGHLDEFYFCENQFAFFARQTQKNQILRRM
jgi:hypothetical protein